LVAVSPVGVSVLAWFARQPSQNRPFNSTSPGFKGLKGFKGGRHTNLKPLKPLK
jgi:hypothetical protein